MPRGLDLNIEVVGLSEAVRDFDEISLRMLNLTPAWERVQNVLQEGEKRLFSRAHGRYVNTGATRDSLTIASANNAIRFMHADAYEFGTSVWYAKFLRKAPKGKRAAKTTKSAVLVLQPKERKASRELILDYIVGKS